MKNPKENKLISMRPVKSGAAKNVGYDSGTNTLVVEFKSGQTYHYKDVPFQTYDALLKADSFGKTLQSSIIGKYPQERVGK